MWSLCKLGKRAVLHWIQPAKASTALLPQLGRCCTIYVSKNSYILPRTVYATFSYSSDCIYQSMVQCRSLTSAAGCCFLPKSESPSLVLSLVLWQTITFLCYLDPHSLALVLALVPYLSMRHDNQPRFIIMTTRTFLTWLTHAS